MCSERLFVGTNVLNRTNGIVLYDEIGNHEIQNGILREWYGTDYMQKYSKISANKLSVYLFACLWGAVL